MATGERAFSRGSAPETMAAIIRDEPKPMGGLAPLTPAPLRWIVERCLTKSPDDRYASTRDLARDLATLKERLPEATATASGGVAPVPAVPVASKALRAVPWAIAVLLAAGLAWLLSSAPKPKTEPATPLRFSVTLPPGVVLSETDIESHSSISPDGRWIVFVGFTGEKDRLYLRAVDSLEARALTGTDGAITPFWSPDSRFIGFFADGKIQKIAVGGGPPQIICDAGIECRPSWGSGGQILFLQLGRPEIGGIWAVDANGGKPRHIRSVDFAHGEGAHVWPFFLPDGKHFLFVTIVSARERSRLPLRVSSLDSPDKATEIAEVASRVEYAGRDIFSTCVRACSWLNRLT